MDPQSDLPSLVEDLEVNIDELTSALSPLLSPLPNTASTLPLLDKAKLYILAAYAIESLLFSSLSASGTNAKQHAVFKELARLKAYFVKIKDIEERGAAPQKARLDVAAAQRFIKHGLAGNERYDLERAERIAKEKARAAVKAALLHKRFDEKEEEEKMQGVVTPRKRGVEEGATEGDGSDVDMESEHDAVAALEGALATPETKKQRRDADGSAVDTDSALTPSTTQPSKRKKRGKGKKGKHSADSTSDESSSGPKDTKKKRDRKKKGIKKLDLAWNSDNEEGIWPEKAPDNAPKTRSETFNALLQGSLASEREKGKGKAKGKAKGNGSSSGK